MNQRQAQQQQQYSTQQQQQQQQQMMSGGAMMQGMAGAAGYAPMAQRTHAQQQAAQGHYGQPQTPQGYPQSAYAGYGMTHQQQRMAHPAQQHHQQYAAGKNAYICFFL